MLADELDYVIGVDPHRDTHALAVVDVRSGGVVFEATALADGEGYKSVLRLADQHAPGRRAFAIEGTGSFGAGLARFLVSQEERVLEVGRLRRERRSGKNDALDAIRSITAGAPDHLLAGGWLLLEHGPDQGPAVRGLLADAGLGQIQTTADLAGLPRVTEGRWRS